MNEILIIILGVWAVITTAMYIITYWDKKSLNEKFEDYKNKIKKDEELRNSGRKVIPVVYNHNTYFIYQDSTMMEAINMIGLKPNNVYYDRTSNNKFNAGFIKYYGQTSFSGIIGEDLTLGFENGTLKSIRNN
jgi:hypothetical protein